LRLIDEELNVIFNGYTVYCVLYFILCVNNKFILQFSKQTWFVYFSILRALIFTHFFIFTLTRYNISSNLDTQLNSSYISCFVFSTANL